MIFSTEVIANIRIQKADMSYCMLKSTFGKFKFIYKDELDTYPKVGPTMLVEWNKE